MQLAIATAKQGYTLTILALGMCFQTYHEVFSKTHAKPCQD
jgi:hypothetical protein